jgi:hypothetical protein
VPLGAALVVRGGEPVAEQDRKPREKQEETADRRCIHAPAIPRDSGRSKRGNAPHRTCGMNLQEVLTLVQGLGVFGFLTAFLLHRREAPKAAADAEKTHADAVKTMAEADILRISGLAQEVGRLQERVQLQDATIKSLREDIDGRISHEAKLEQENRALRAKVSRQDRRITALEAILKVQPVTAEMQAELDKLEREDLEA